jgi:hypothetical protein
LSGIFFKFIDFIHRTLILLFLWRMTFPYINFTSWNLILIWVNNHLVFRNFVLFWLDVRL